MPEGVITVTTGASGSGKSYFRCARFLVDEFLYIEDGPVWSNYPLGLVPESHLYPPKYDGETFADRIAEAVAKKRKCEPEQVKKRINTIPDSVLKSWVAGDSGPWDFFRDKDLAGAHIAIDEIHNYYSRKSSRAWKGKWQAWLGEVRHQGATAECLTQSPGKIAKELYDECEIRLMLTNSATTRDPIFGILIGDWYELRSGIFGLPHRTRTWLSEQKQHDGRWLIQSRRVFTVDKAYWRFYDTFSAPQAGGRSGKARSKPHESLGRLALLLWFWRRNFSRLIVKGSVVLLILWLTVGGGGGRILSVGIVALTDGIVGGAFSAASAAIVSSDDDAPALGSALAGEPADPTPGSVGSVSTAAVAASEATAPPVLPAGQPAEPVALPEAAEPPYVVELRSLVAQQQATLEALTSELVTVTAERDAGRLVLLRLFAFRSIDPGGVLLASGHRVRVGDRFPGGPLAGRVLDGVDWPRREAVLDDATRHGVARLALPELRSAITDFLGAPN